MVHPPDVRHRQRQAALGGLFVPAQGDRIVFGDPVAFMVERAEIVGASKAALVCGNLIEFARPRKILLRGCDTARLKREAGDFRVFAHRCIAGRPRRRDVDLACWNAAQSTGTLCVQGARRKAIARCLKVTTLRVGPFGQPRLLPGGRQTGGRGSRWARKIEIPVDRRGRHPGLLRSAGRALYRQTDFIERLKNIQPATANGARKGARIGAMPVISVLRHAARLCGI